jgi:ubiquinone/menaquinone biosynthesis C-methylase UbiE
MDNKEIWETKYKDTGDPFHVENKYDQELIDIKLRMMQSGITDCHELIVDIGCGTGDFLLHEHKNFRQAIGVDFSKIMIDQFSKRIKQSKIKNIILYKGEARNIPTSKEKVDLVFSYATLYYVPDIEEVFIEINRALKPGGIAVLELGNSWSFENILGWLNHLLFGWSKHYCINPFKMNNLIKKNNLHKIIVRRFQLIPVASLPTFLSKMFKYFLGIKIKGKMVDEWISSAPIFRFFAYRNIYIIQKNLNIVKKELDN